MDRDLKEVDGEGMGVGMGEWVEVGDGCGMLDEEKRVRDGGWVGVDVVGCVGLVEGFDVGKGVGLCVGVGIVVEMGEMVGEIVKVVVWVVVLLGGGFEGVEVEGGLFCCDSVRF